MRAHRPCRPDSRTCSPSFGGLATPGCLKERERRGRGYPGRPCDAVALSSLRQLDRVPALPPPARLLVEQQPVDRRLRARRLALLAQRQPPTRDLNVQVRLCPARHLLEHVVAPDDVGDRAVDSVVPAGGSLGQGHGMATLQTEEVLVAEDVLQELVITS